MYHHHRITQPLHFITTTVVDWIDIFSRPSYKHIIIDSLQFCQQHKGLKIYAWVLMSNHLHMIISTESETAISDIIRDFKKFTSKKVITTLQNDLQESRREWMLKRFEYAGKGNPKIKKYKLWKDGVDNQIIFTNDYYRQKVNYIHQNPVRAEIVNSAEDYRYSSARDYAGGKGLLEIVVVE